MDTELESQQLKANELAKKEPGVEEHVEVVEVVDVDTELESQQLKANELAKKEPGVEEHVEVVEVVDVDTELESQQLKANELAKKEPGVAFNIKRRQGKLFAECNVCSSEVAVGQANQNLSLLKLHIITSRHKLNVAISRSRSSEIPTEIQGLRNQIEGKFPKVFHFQGEEVLCRSCNTSFAISQRSLLFNLKQHVEGRSHQQKASRVGSMADIASFFHKTARTQDNSK